jgi:signal transduction histidine kinase
MTDLPKRSDAPKADEGAMAEDMRRVLSLFMDAPGGMIVTEGPDHVVTMMNSAYRAWIGGAEVIGKPVREVFPNMVELGFYAMLDEVFTKGETRTIHGDRTVVALPDGRSHEAYVNFVLQPIRGADGAVAGIFCQGHEVTRERKAVEELKAAHARHLAAEAKLRQAQKMEAIGRLTGGIAHDFNNLLTVVIGAAEALADQLADRPDLEPVARMALEAADRGAELVSQLMSVSRTQSLAPQTVNCGRFLEALTPILTRTLPKDIEIAVQAGSDELCCRADLTQLTSAMLNLCINARDAMPDGGRLALSVSGGADEVGLTVSDNGEGMSPQVLARALEPFYTTKPEGKGSGLGLAMVYGFAEQSGGRLEIDSAPGQGTRIRLSLPRVQPCAEADRPAPPATALAPGLKVLLVDDDERVRVQVGRQLAALGCEVRACACGHEALDALAAGDPVDLMMTDIHMPGGLNGRQLADHARLLDPSLRILFTSGHTEDPVLRTVGHDPNAAFLPKPYRRAELARKLAELV